MLNEFKKRCKKKKKKSSTIFLLHFISAVILGAEGCRDGHHHCRASVAEDVEVTVQEAFVVDDANHY